MLQIQQIEALNQALFLKINATPNTPDWLLSVTMVIAHDLIFCLPLILTGMWFLGSHRVRSIALEALVAVVIALSINKVIGQYWACPRPFVIGLGYQYLQHAATPSFPSNHMTIFACIGITFLLGRLFILGFALFAIGLMVGSTRVFLGIHFPLDIMGGIIVAMITCGILDLFWKRIGNSTTQFFERYSIRSKYTH